MPIKKNRYTKSTRSYTKRFVKLCGFFVPLRVTALKKFKRSVPEYLLCQVLLLAFEFQFR